METSLNTKRILIFLAIAFGIPWTAALAIFLTMGSDLASAASLANLIFISTPWLANVLTRLVTREGRGNLMLWPNFRFGWPYYLALWLLPFLAVVVGAAAFFLLLPQSFDPNLGEVRKLVANSPSAGMDPWLVLFSITLSIMLISSLINTVVSFGEEFGWRAYLLPKLVAQFTRKDAPSASDFNSAGARKAVLAVGLIHGVWHWPLLITTASLVPGTSFLTLLAYLVFTTALSILWSWGTLRSRSVWPAALGHGTVNATSALPGFLLKGQPIPLLGPDPTGLIGGIGYIILAVVLFLSRKAFAGEKEVGSKKVSAQAGAPGTAI